MLTCQNNIWYARWRLWICIRELIHIVLQINLLLIVEKVNKFVDGLQKNDKKKGI
jgi:hypothetical protein